METHSRRSSEVEWKEKTEESPHRSLVDINNKSVDEEAIVVAPESEELPYSRARLIALVITLAGAAFLNTLNIQSVVIVLPTIGHDLDVPTSRQQWVVSAYSLTFGCFLLLMGRLADVFGKKVIFLFGSAWLTVTSIILPFVRDEIGFDILRALQGLGGAANVPTAVGILGATFNAGRAKNYAFACFGAGAPLGAILGNILGGVIGEYLTWNWIFWISSMLSALITVAGFFVIPLPLIQHCEGGSKGAVDWVGGFLITSGLLLLLFVLTEGNVVGWSTPWVPALIVVSLLLVALFAAWQWFLEYRLKRRPLMKISIWSNYRFAGAMAVMATFYASFNNFLIFASYYYQDYLGLTIIQTTLRFLATGVTGILVTLAVGPALSHVSAAPFLSIGTLATAIACLLFAVPIAPPTPYWEWSFFAMILAAIGVDSVSPALQLFTTQVLPKEDQALGGGLINASGQLGRAIGLAIATAVQTAVEARAKGESVQEAGMEAGVPRDPALLGGLRAAEWLNFALAVLSFGVVLCAFRGAGKLGAKRA